ncbi:putative RNA-directed DNA polymerase from transposon X-element [Takifugu flavidus]|uniref:Putative RNA-directed DNA polymerase from transposon X-element n=1 Tax=Takifugu flavidus TaxID=433684 RepID=A0A5C6MCJ9_9TELE|nr:putative RNA-directed DNA polymerase from transposon X-element [Takifugu flavidus]
MALPPSSPPPFTISEQDVRRQFARLNPRKAPGPDGVSPSTLRHRAEELTPVFTDIFNSSLESCQVPACLKTSTIVPVPKKPWITGLNDYRPVALTSVVMKSLERLILPHLKSITTPLLDPLQFAYRANRSVDDAVNLALHSILQHLDSPGTYARILFVDFSSAFNTIRPALLQDKLSQLSVPASLCSTGSPQGCVLSPLLFSLYTNCCTSSHQSVKLIKFADDTTLIGLISNGDETAYRREVARLVSWCGHNNLQLNAQKTVEMIVDFRKVTAPLPPLALMDSPITIADSFRFLGTTITRDLKWEPTISSLIKKAQQRMFFLRKLRKLKLPPRMLAQFYTAIIESILTSSIMVLCWCHRQGQTKAAARHARCREGDGLQASIHPGPVYLQDLEACRRLRSIRTKTSRYMNSFFPSAIRLLNTK